MKFCVSRVRLWLVSSLLSGVVAAKLHAGAVIINPAGTIALGVNDEGHLNFTDPDGLSPASANGTGGAVGLSIVSGGQLLDVLSPGCLCEGWGVSGNNSESGFANVSSDFGANNLTVESFSSTASTATSVVTLSSFPSLKVTQAYAPAANAPGILFEDVVTIQNTDLLSSITNVQYVRVMDWDLPPVSTGEYVTIHGTAAAAPYLVRSNDNGFASANPLIDSSGSPEIVTGTTNVDFTDSLGFDFTDHGAYFKFNFGTLAPGASTTFSIFYGAGFSESSVVGALNAVGTSLYSLAQSGPIDAFGLPTGTGDQVAGTPFTFAFGFKAPAPVGPPTNLTPVPEPATYGLFGGIALGALILSRRRSKQS
jgi:hypothetical protein